MFEEFALQILPIPLTAGVIREPDTADGDEKVLRLFLTLKNFLKKILPMPRCCHQDGGCYFFFAKRKSNQKEVV